MNSYLAGTAVTVTAPMQDSAGNALMVSAVSYRVISQTGAELVPKTSIVDFVEGSEEATVTVAADINVIADVPATITSNQVDAFDTKEARTVEFFLTISADGNVVIKSITYILESQDPLVVGVNSFQTLPHAEVVAFGIPNLNGWNAASDHEKIAALVDARTRICQLNFWLLNSNVNWGQDSLNYVPEGAYQTPYVSGGNSMFIFNGNLSLLTPTQYERLPVRFKSALAKAQVTEADSILAGDTIDSRRRDGLMLEAIGEVKQMFRSTKPVELPISKRAMRYLSQFVTLSKRIGRA